MRVPAIIVLAVVAGISLGRLTGSQPATGAVDHFGPFTEVEGFTAEQLPEYLGSLVSPDTGIVEVVGPQDFDFGIMHRNTEAEHAFQIKNVGSGPLRMKVAGSTCKCTVGELETDTINPGETADVKLSWKTIANGNEFAQTATIQTSDPYTAELKLSVHGSLVDSMVAEPMHWAVGDVTSGDPIDLSLTAYSYEEGAVEILGAEFIDPRVQELTKVDWMTRMPNQDSDGKHSEARQAIDFRVTIQPGLGQGMLNHVFRVRYKGENVETAEASFDVNLAGKIVGPLRLLGGSKLEQSANGGGYRFNIGLVKQGVERKERVHLVIRGDEYKDLRVKVAEISPEDVFAVTLGEENRRGTLRTIPIDITVRPDAPVGLVRGQKSIDTGYVLLEPQGSQLSPLKLWLTVEVTAVDN